jgi:nicotinamidase-related amidase
VEDATNLHGEHGRTKSPVVLLLVDVINDFEFEGGEDLLEPALAMARCLATLKQRARAARVPCIYSNDNWGRWRSNFQQIVEGCRGTRGWPVAEQLLPDEDDYFVLKAKHSAFYETPLDLLLRHLGATTLVICGIATDNCVLFTASDGYMRDYRIVLPTDCMASEQPEWRDAALVHMERVLKADLVCAADVDFARLSRERRE